MTVKIDESGRRSIQVEVEVPGTPEEVWQAISTGPGISAWFVPTDVEGRVGGTLTSHFGPGMDAHSTITAWDPPYRSAHEGSLAPNSPPLATEWIVEARSGGTCIVRVVHSLFASGDDWDDQLNSTEAGWPSFFQVLRIHLEHFRGQPCSYFGAMGMSAGTAAQAWDTITVGLGLPSASEGERVRSTGVDAPTLSGIVEPLGESSYGRNLLLLLDEPAQGAGLIAAHDCGGVIMASISLYLYGDDAADVVAREEPKWRAWMSEHFPTAGSAGTAH
jgi:uncharacterized protein YndB with AHSA1/START domain